MYAICSCVLDILILKETEKLETRSLFTEAAMAQMFSKIGVFKNFATFTRKHETQHRYLPINVAKFLRLNFFTEHFW